MKGPQAAGTGRARVSAGLLGSRRVPAVESGAGPLLAMAGAVVGASGGWGALAGLMGAVVFVGDPFWPLGTGQSR